MTTIRRLRRSNSGQAMVEFICVLVPLLLLILGTLQFALIYQAKLTLNYAAFETARAGALTGARMIFMENAFARAMAPLYTNPFLTQAGGSCGATYDLDPTANVGMAVNEIDLTIDNVECGRARMQDKIDNREARIVLINPSTASFDDFGEDFEVVRDFDNSADQSLSAVRTIPNDSLMYRSAAVGANSLQSIQDANLIKTHVSLCFDLIVPVAGRVISQLMTNDDSLRAAGQNQVGGGLVNRWGFGPLPAGSFGETCANNGGIPLYAQSIMRMHSPAVEEITRCTGFCN